MTSRIKLFLTDVEYRTLLKVRRRVRRRERAVYRALVSTDDALKARNPNVNRKELIRFREGLSKELNEILQTLHEIDIALKEKRGLDRCDNL